MRAYPEGGLNLVALGYGVSTPVEAVKKHVNIADYDDETKKSVYPEGVLASGRSGPDA